MRCVISAAARRAPVVGCGAGAQLDPPAWTRPTAAFPITPDIWYVGSEGLAAYLVKTPRGAILLDGTMAPNVPGIEQNIAAAGVKLRDVKYILVSHAHFDHADGRRGAGAGDRARGCWPGRATSRRCAPASRRAKSATASSSSPRCRARAGCATAQRITLGGTTLTAIATPGHTPGCTSYRMTSGGKRGAVRVQPDGRGQQAGRQRALSGDRARLPLQLCADGTRAAGHHAAVPSRSSPT